MYNFLKNLGYIIYGFSYMCWDLLCALCGVIWINTFGRKK